MVQVDQREAKANPNLNPRARRREGGVVVPRARTVTGQGRIVPGLLGKVPLKETKKRDRLNVRCATKSSSIMLVGMFTRGSILEKNRFSAKFVRKDLATPLTSSAT